MIILLMWSFALRCRELSGLRVRDINFFKGEIHIPEEIAKGDSDGFIPFVSSEFMHDLQGYIHDNRLNSPDYVIHHGRNRKPYSTRQIHRIVKGIGIKAGLPHMRPHLLRHSKARWLLENGYNIGFVKQFLRHKRVQITVDPMSFS